MIKLPLDMVITYSLKRIQTIYLLCLPSCMLIYIFSYAAVCFIYIFMKIKNAIIVNVDSY